ncbi:MAG: 50S ribosomal protein L15 [Candidatus Moranbacteria bacterium]|nr:50S ribosomal protein L15 [Candidatus Moranbacteria bacterium]
MQIHQLKPDNKSKSRKRVGRGGKRGTYSGKGMKGQNSRSGTGGTHIVEKGRTSWVKRFPKLGGFNSVFLPNIVVKTSLLEKNYKSGETVNLKSLLEKKLISKPKKGQSKKIQRVKILYDGKISKELNISGCLISQKAKNLIEKAGGKIELSPETKGTSRIQKSDKKAKTGQE